MEEIGIKKRKEKKKNTSKSRSVGWAAMSVVVKLHCWFVGDHSLNWTLDFEGKEDSELGLRGKPK